MSISRLLLVTSTRLLPLRALAALVGLVVAVYAAMGQQASSQPTLRIWHLDVGQGDATLLVTPEGKRILIDAGPTERQIVQHLAALNIDTLDLVIASHNHADHIGGLPGVFRAVVVKAYLDNGIPHTTGIYGRTLESVDAEKGLQYLAATDRYIDAGPVRLHVLPPSQIDNTQNNNSVGVLLTFGEFTALYTGDSERAELLHWLARQLIPHVTLHKAAHHGSANGATAEFAAAVSPRIVVISVGPNSYGHPAPGIEQEWIAAGAKVYRTDLHGTIEVRATPDGKFTIVTSKGP